MFTRPLVITDIGKTILFRAMQGEPFEFTCFRVGDGTMTGTETPETATAMKHVITDVGTDPTAQTGDIEISEYDVEEGENGKYFQLTGKFNNLTLQSQFDWTELGLFIKCTNPNAQDYDDEQLYAYGYDGSNPETIKTNEYGVAVEQTFTVIVAIGTAENITVNILHPQYAPMDQFENHINATGNVHSLSLQEIGAAPELHQHDASDIVNGILPPERGGTGVGSIPELEALLNIGGAMEYFDGSQVDSSSPYADVTGVYHSKQKFVFGAFMGDGRLYKKIQLGFKPSMVYMFRMNTGGASIATQSFAFSPGMNIYHSGCGANYISKSAEDLFAIKEHGGAVVTDYGFAVGFASSSGRQDINVSGSMYFFIAVRGDGSGDDSGDETTPDVSNLSISQKNTLTYNGQAQTPTFNVTYQGNELVQGTDYDLTVTARVNAGTYTATITGRSFNGSKEVSWTINRKSVSGTFAVSPTVLKDFHPTNAQVDYPEYTSLTITCTSAGGGLLNEDYMIHVPQRHFFTNGMAIGGKGIEEYYSKRTVINFAYVDSTVTVIQNPYLRVYAYSQNYITEVVTLNLTVA